MKRSRDRFTCSLCSSRASVSRSKRIPHSHRSRIPEDSLARCCTLDSAAASDRSYLRRSPRRCCRSGHTFLRSPSSPPPSFRRRRPRRRRPRLLPRPAPRPAPSLSYSRSADRSQSPRTTRSRNCYYFAESFDATPGGAAVDCCCRSTSISSKTVAVVWSTDDPPDGSCVSSTRRT